MAKQSEFSHHYLNLKCGNLSFKSLVMLNKWLASSQLGYFTVSFFICYFIQNYVSVAAKSMTTIT